MVDRALPDAIRAELRGPRDVARLLGLLDGAKPQAGGVSVRCPSHADDTASCSLTPGPDGTLRVRCFGCPLSGDVLTLIGAVAHLDLAKDFRKVLERGAELASVDLRSPVAPSPRRAPPSGPPRLADERFHAIVASLLHVGRLDRSDVARDVSSYLEGRGLLDAALVDGWAALPPPDFQESTARMLLQVAEPITGPVEGDEALFGRREIPYSREDIEASGILDASGRIPWGENRLIIPWRSPSGVVATIQRRRLDAQKDRRYVFPRGRSPLYPYGVERVSLMPADAPVAFVEGAADVLALRALLAARGECALVLGLPGVGGWRSQWAELARGRVAAVALDSDEGGQSKVRKLADDLAQAGAKYLERWDSPKSKDWAEGGAS